MSGIFVVVRCPECAGVGTTEFRISDRQKWIHYCKRCGKHSKLYSEGSIFENIKVYGQFTNPAEAVKVVQALTENEWKRTKGGHDEVQKLSV
jgi:transcription elongation factor Elf1